MLSWKSDEKELYWVHLDIESGDALVMASDIAVAPVFQAGAPRLLFRIPNAQQRINGGGSISRDGQQFVFTMMDQPAK